MGSGCLRPRENPLQDITTIRQQPNTNGTGSTSSFESPSYNGIYVHPFVQRIPTISSSYSDPPPSYSKISIAPYESPPTYQEAVSDHSRFNLWN
ncbi:hypothetical protein ACJMK2_017297 [Sinanodonta woodiana]|uniref:Uncharacterized protein n=1 Tax=Sinanodonta woodiana TaxID=1069815 RepID=A0ABD3UWF7_SINWO